MAPAPNREMKLAETGASSVDAGATGSSFEGRHAPDNSLEPNA
jgi:hypothetical protein